METREYQIRILTKIIQTNIEIVNYRKSMATEQKHIDICNKMLRMCNKAIRELPKIKHSDIINSLYNSLVIRNESWFSYIAPSVVSPTTKKWDTTKKGYEEFLRLEEEAQEIAKAKFEEQQKQREIIKQAKENGDKIEMQWDNETKSLKPIIVKENNNA